MKEIKVLGTGCPKCTRLIELAEQAANELGVECVVTKVDDITEIISFGVLRPPALVVGGEVKVSGRLPSLDELKVMLSQAWSIE